MNCPRCSEHCCDCRDIDEVAELRAYKERTEAALRELCLLTRIDGKVFGGVSIPPREAELRMRNFGLWRDKEWKP